MCLTYSLNNLKKYYPLKYNKNEIKKSILKKGIQREYLLSEIVFNTEDKKKLDTKVQNITKTITTRNKQ